jgi:hypothetical protein
MQAQKVVPDSSVDTFFKGSAMTETFEFSADVAAAAGGVSKPVALALLVRVLSEGNAEFLEVQSK